MSNLEDATGFFVDKAGNTLDPTTTSQSPDCWLSDALDIVTQDLPVTLGASLAKTFTTLASARHVVMLFVFDKPLYLCTMIRRQKNEVLLDVCSMSAVMSFEQVAMLTRPHTALFCLDRAALVNRPRRPLLPFKLQPGSSSSSTNLSIPASFATLASI